MRRRTLGKQDGFTAVNVTPLIDVVMCLIVFYLMVGRLASDEVGTITLPVTRAGEREEREGGGLVVNVVAREGGAGGVRGAADIVVEGRGVEVEEVEGIVRARVLAEPGVVVRVRGDRRLAYGAVEPVLRACARGGARVVRLGTERGE